jgi:hypothetical protein
MQGGFSKPNCVLAWGARHVALRLARPAGAARTPCRRQPAGRGQRTTHLARRLRPVPRFEAACLELSLRERLDLQGQHGRSSHHHAQSFAGQDVPLATLAFSIGRAVELELKAPPLEPWSDSVQFRVGMVLIETVVNTTGWLHIGYGSPDHRPTWCSPPHRSSRRHYGVARQSGWESSDNQDGHFGGRGGEMIVAARR